MTGRPSKVLFICVNYNSHQDTRDLLNQIVTMGVLDFVDVVVVDNSDRLPSENDRFKESEFPSEIKILKAPCNLGYLGGGQWGYVQATSKKSYDWIIISNTDVRFSSPDFFNQLINLSKDDPPAVLGPKVTSIRTGCDQNPYMYERPTRRQMKIYRWIFRSYWRITCYHLLSVLKSRVRWYFKGTACKMVQQIGIPRKVIYAPHGSFMVFHRSYFERGGNLDHGVFLYGEEIFIAENVRRLGLKVVYDPRLEVVHREHATTGLLPSPRIARYMSDAITRNSERFFV